MGYIPSKVGRATLGISGTTLHALSERLRPLTVGTVGIRGKDERSGAVWRPDKSPVGLRSYAQIHWAFAFTGPRARR